MNKYNIGNAGVTLAAIFGIVVAFLVIMFGSFLYGVFATGFVSMKLWAWFVVPIFGVKALTITQAYGLALIIGLWTHQHFVNTNKDERETSEKVSHWIALLITPWFVLFVGWIVHAFLM